MSAITEKNRWNKKIPYANGYPGFGELEERIKAFNDEFTTPIFVPYVDQADSVVFQDGHNSPIGKQGGKQELKCKLNNLYHEMGHCCGLGHTYFHDGCHKFTDMFEGVNKEAFDSVKANYVNYGDTFVKSMMAYTPTVFQASPRIKRIMEACGKFPKRHDLVDVEYDIRKLINLRNEVDTAQGGRKFSIVSEVPQRFKHLADSIEKLKALDKNSLQSILTDVGIVKEYWCFDEDHMKRIESADIEAIKKVMGL